MSKMMRLRLLGVPHSYSDLIEQFHEYEKRLFDKNYVPLCEYWRSITTRPPPPSRDPCPLSRQEKLSETISALTGVRAAPVARRVPRALLCSSGM